MGYRFNPAPGWPAPPEGWVPPEGWQPDPSWPPAPHGWEFWVATDSAAPAPLEQAPVEPGPVDQAPVPALPTPEPEIAAPREGLRFNPAPGWPAPPAGWEPPPGWQPNPDWPPAPEGWELWIPQDTATAEVVREAELSPEPGGAVHNHEETVGDVPEPVMVPEPVAATEPDADPRGWGQPEPAPAPAIQEQGPRFNPAPGWPAPPIGWEPPPGWQPDPSWPPAPEGWQFWVTDGVPAPTTPAAPQQWGHPGEVPAAAHSGQQPPVQSGSLPPALAGQQPPAPSPVSFAQSHPQQHFAGGQNPPGAFAEPPKKSRKGLIIGIIVGLLILLIALVWGIVSLFSSSSGSSQPVTTPTATESEAPTPGQAPSAPPMETEAPGAAGWADAEEFEGIESTLVKINETVTLSEFDPFFGEFTEIGTATVTNVERDWRGDPDSFLCAEAPEEGEYIKIDIRVETAADLEKDFFFFSNAFGFGTSDNQSTGMVSVFDTILCLNHGTELESSWEAGQTYSGSLLASVTPGTTKLWYFPTILAEVPPMYEWDLTDF